MHKPINHPSVSVSPSYSAAVEVVTPARWLFISGQVGRDANRNIPDGIEEQADIAWRNLVTILTEAGMTVDDIAETTLYLVELRASQINGCGVCVDIHSRQLKLAGEPDARINTVAAWRDVSYFTDAERAALALTEAVTRIADRADAVSDDVWDEAARHYDGAQLAALVLAIASINTWNRLNVATRQVGGDWVGQWLAQEQKDTAAA